jgi:predicted nuclease of predicted toxin-antitoxin system
MRIKLDENLPVHLAAILTNLHHNVHTIAEENLSGKSDREVWEAAQQDERFLITQDLDFSDLRRFAREHTAESYWFDFILQIAKALSVASQTCFSGKK